MGFRHPPSATPTARFCRRRGAARTCEPYKKKFVFSIMNWGALLACRHLPSATPTAPCCRRVAQRAHGPHQVPGERLVGEQARARRLAQRQQAAARLWPAHAQGAPHGRAFPSACLFVSCCAKSTTRTCVSICLPVCFLLRKESTTRTCGSIWLTV